MELRPELGHGLEENFGGSAVTCIYGYRSRG